MTEPSPGVAARGSALYPLGFFALLLVDSIFHQWTMYFHVPGDSHDPALSRQVGFALLASNVAQGVADPFVGAYADRVRHRWGRRRPFILVCTPLLALLFASLFWQPGAGTLLRVPLYGVLFVTVAQPYMSMLPSLAGPGPTRVRISLASNLCMLLATSVALVGAPALVARIGFRGFGLLGAASLIVMLFLPVLVLREPTPPEGELPTGGVLAGLRALLAIRTVRSFLAGNICAFIAMTLLTVLAPYIPTALLGLDVSELQALNGWLFAGMLLSVPLIGRLSRRFAPRRVYGAGALAAVLVISAALIAGGVLSRGGYCAAFFLLGFPAILTLAAPPLELARLADTEARGQEGMLFGLNGLIAPGIGRALGAQGASLLLAQKDTYGLSGSVRAGLAVSGAAFATAAVILLTSALSSSKRREGD